MSAEVRNRNYAQFIAEALDLEMAADPKVLVLGEDVGAMGGVYGATRGLQRRYGEWRVRDTPISEMAFTGMGVGLAMAGFRPVVEVMFADFASVCLEQIVNAAAKIPFMSGGRMPVPIVFKMAAGSEGSAAQHSQAMWGTFAHFPGLRVVTPASPFDAKGMMAAAVRSPDPVIFLEHKDLLIRKAADFRSGAAVPKEAYTSPLAGAAVVRPGRDVSVVALSAAVESALSAAEMLEEEGVDAEVVDLRAVVPLDVGLVEQSLRRTGRLLVVDEDYLSFGMSGELVTRLHERLEPAARSFPFRRLANPDVPVPAARTLESCVLPTPERILAAALEIIAEPAWTYDRGRT